MLRDRFFCRSFQSYSTDYRLGQSLIGVLYGYAANEDDGYIIDSDLEDIYQEEPPLGRILVIEDLTREVVEVLGSSLNIDPLFFASHIHTP